MSDALMIILLTTAAGACIPLGGLIASFESIRPQWLENELRHFIIAVGGGILLGSVALVLVPEGLDSMEQSPWAVVMLLAGGVAFFLLEIRLARNQKDSPQLMGMLLDYIPEAMALGGLLAVDSTTAVLLALLIGLQNLPEGFNAFREMLSGPNGQAKKTLLYMLALVPIGPAAGLLGFYVLGDSANILGAIMLFASGGILYLIFQDIAPQSHLSKHWGPPLGAVLGFSITMISNLLVQA